MRSAFAKLSFTPAWFLKDCDGSGLVLEGVYRGDAGTCALSRDAVARKGLKYAELFRAGGSSPPGVPGANPAFFGVRVVCDLDTPGTCENGTSVWSRLDRVGIESVYMLSALSRPGENAADLAE